MPRSRAATSGPTGALAVRTPDVALTKSGISFRPSDDLWDWLDGPFHLRLNFIRVEGQFAHLRGALKACLSVYAKGHAAHYVQNLFNGFMHFVSSRDASMPFMAFSAAEMSSYAARLKPHERWRLGLLNVLLQKWHALGLPGVDDECVDYLRERRKPGNEKGAAVRTHDPVHGPFSEAEYTALYKAVDAAYGLGEVPQWVTLLTRLLFVCGGRISQYASLKLMDLTSRDGSLFLQLPQVKNGEKHSRMLFKEFSLSPQTGRFAQEFIDAQLLAGQTRESPMFREDLVMKRPGEQRRSSTDLFLGHCTGQTLSRVLVSSLEQITPPTERLNYAGTPVAPKRFRYTRGTRMAEEGASKAVIADTLGHADLQNVDVYFEGSPKIVENIDKTMGGMLAPLAGAYRGRLIADEAHSTHKGAAGSRIIDFRVGTTPLASCSGKGRGCAFDKPVACYTCFKFEPWLDAPHEKVLERLENERRKHGDDPRMAAINDDAIQAVREVIAECAQVRAQRERGASA